MKNEKEKTKKQKQFEKDWLNWKKELEKRRKQQDEKNNTSLHTGTEKEKEK